METHTLLLTRVAALGVCAMLGAPRAADAHSYEVTGPYWVADPVHTSTPLASGDVDNDGRADLVSCFSATRVIVFRQGADRMLHRYYDAPIWTPFAPTSPNTIYSYAAYCINIDVADISADGRDDIVITHTAGVTVLVAQAVGGFARQELRASEDDSSGRGKRTGALIDVDGDGKTDLLVARQYGAFGYLRNDGAGNLSDEVVVPGTATPGRMATGDLNADGRPDFAIVGTQYSAPETFCFLDMYLNDGNGGFAQQPRRKFLKDTYAETLAIGDVTGDGKDDIVVTSGANRPLAMLFVLVQESSGISEKYLRYPTLDIPSSVAIRDMNADGLNDVVANHRGWWAVTTYLQTPGGLSLQPPVYDLWNNNDDPQAFAIGDFDSDSCNDVAVSVSGQFYLLNGRDCARPDNVFGNGFE